VSGGYAVPKHRVEARLRLLHQEPRTVLLHLGERAARHSGREVPSDLLNEGGSFFPVNDPGEGQVRLVRKRSVVWAEVAAAEEELAEGGASVISADDPESTVQSVRILFEDGSDAVGEIRWVLPPGRRRLRDFLDAAEAFFPLCEGDRVRLVNRDRISLIELR
jgi:hypothetical protein